AGLSADDWLETDQDSLGLRRDIQLDLDTDLFERLAQGRGCEDAHHPVGLYEGDLLEGLGHECFAAERERLSDLYEDLLACVADRRLQRGGLVAARGAGARRRPRGL